MTTSRPSNPLHSPQLGLHACLPAAPVRMNLRQRPATKDDLPAISQITADAFHRTTDPVTRHLFPQHLETEDLSADQAAALWRHARKTGSFGAERTLMMVVCDDEVGGEVVGYAFWEIPIKSSEHDGTGPESLDSAPPHVPATWDETAYDFVKQTLTRAEKETLGEKGILDVWSWLAFSPQLNQEIPSLTSCVFCRS